MAREIVAWCDLDLGTGQRVPAQTYTLNAGAGERTLDLCEVHRKELLDPLVQALNDHGQKVDKRESAPRAAAAQAANSLDVLVHTAATSGTRHGKPRGDDKRADPCPFCPLDYSGMTSVVTHCRAKHGYGEKATSSDIFGRVCPMCNQGGYDMLSVHGRNAHHERSVAQLFAAAKAAGDPFGVVTERVALAQNVIEAAP